MSHEDGPGRRQNESKGPVGGQGILWYMALLVLGFTVVALVMTSMQGTEIAHSDLIRLIENSKHEKEYGELSEGMSGYVIVPSTGRNNQPIRTKFSNLREVKIGDRMVTGKVDVEQTVPVPRRSQTCHQEVPYQHRPGHRDNCVNYACCWPRVTSSAASTANRACGRRMAFCS